MVLSDMVTENLSLLKIKLNSYEKCYLSPTFCNFLRLVTAIFFVV